MAVIERVPLPRAELTLGERIAALQPGDVFWIDRPITVEEFCEYGSDEWHAELVNGVIYVMSPPTDAHEALLFWLVEVLGAYVRTRDLGQARVSRAGVKISGTSLREPDLLFFRKVRLDQMTARGVHGAPDLAIEIVDSRKARRDAVTKQAQYQDIGVGELWVIDLPQQKVRQFLLEEDTYQRLDLEPGDQVVSRAVDGFQLEVAWLFTGPSFPNSLEVVQGLLAGQ